MIDKITCMDVPDGHRLCTCSKEQCILTEYEYETHVCKKQDGEMIGYRVCNDVSESVYEDLIRADLLFKVIVEDSWFSIFYINKNNSEKMDEILVQYD